NEYWTYRIRLAGRGRSSAVAARPQAPGKKTGATRAQQVNLRMRTDLFPFRRHARPGRRSGRLVVVECLRASSVENPRTTGLPPNRNRRPQRETGHPNWRSCLYGERFDGCDPGKEPTTNQERGVNPLRNPPPQAPRATGAPAL